MRTRNRRAAAMREVVSFWSIIIVASLFLAALAFLAGKYWIGGLMAKSDAGNPAPKVIVRTPEELEAAKAGNPENTEPPEKAVVKMEQREPNEGERSEIEQNHPQDGAGLNATGGTQSPDVSTGADTQPMAGDGEGRFKLVAGAYRSEENAQKQIDDLAAKGYAATMVPVKREGTTYHRVIVGSYDDREQANRVRDELASAGVKVTVSSR
ncbi:MAG: SPOR domain-containing protein [Bacteroidota bacterium]